MTKQTLNQLNAIQEYMDAVSDFHEANLLVAEMRTRLVEAIEANKEAGLANPDPLSAIVGAVVHGRTETVVDKVTMVRTSKTNSSPRTRNSPRNSPGYTKKTVYDFLPGDAAAIAKRTGLSKTQIWSAAADLVGAGLVEKHGTKGNTTYVVKGDRLNWSVKKFASITYTSKALVN